jgi:hypothetical protein
MEYEKPLSTDKMDYLHKYTEEEDAQCYGILIEAININNMLLFVRSVGRLLNRLNDGTLDELSVVRLIRITAGALDADRAAMAQYMFEEYSEDWKYVVYDLFMPIINVVETKTNVCLDLVTHFLLKVSPSMIFTLLRHTISKGNPNYASVAVHLEITDEFANELVEIAPNDAIADDIGNFVERDIFLE